MKPRIETHIHTQMMNVSYVIPELNGTFASETVRGSQSTVERSMMNWNMAKRRRARNSPGMGFGDGVSRTVEAAGAPFLRL
jgi:hypothetical protein